MTKGNDGRAARRLLWRKLAVVLSCFAGVLVVLNVLGIGGNNNGSNGITSASSSIIRRPYKKRMRGGSEGHVKGGGGPRLIQVDLDDAENADVRNKLMSASIHLVNLQVDQSNVKVEEDGSYSGVYGDFCELNFAVHKRDPSLVPMFRDLVSHSPDCDKQRYRVDLHQVAQLARRTSTDDDKERTKAKSLTLGGVVFHESRCGSTLVANALIGMNPQRHRVYSESAPPIAAMRNVCGETFASTCSVDTAARVLRDTLYLMGRSNDHREDRVFFKIQSVGTRSLRVFQRALPRTPWMFVYRDPVQVLASQLAHGSRNANCVQTKSSPPTIVRTIATKKGFRSAKQLTYEEYCAAHLASLTESAVAALERAPELGVAVNYADLPSILYTDILPNRWNISVSSVERDNIVAISGVYSKGRGGNRAGEWHQDSEVKEEGASLEIRKAADLFLQDSYRLLQGETTTGHDSVVEP